MQQTLPKRIELPDPVYQDAGGEPTVRPLVDRPGVLVVDDEYPVRKLVQVCLEVSGFDVWLAASGVEAARLYQKHQDRIAVVLLDVRMPGLDGPATLEALREINPEVRACFMSGDTGAYGNDDLRRRGAACFIAKPFRLDELVNVLRRVARGVPADGFDDRAEPSPLEPQRSASGRHSW
jgi:CheY-like chemotaxis protein